MNRPHDALVALVEADSADVLAYLLRRVEVAEDAADVLAEAQLALARKPGRIPAEPEQARMWFFGVARRTLAAHRRRAGKTRAGDAALRHYVATLAETAATDPADGFADVRSAVAALPERQRDLVMLVHWDGFTLAQAAAHLGIKESTARTHHQRAREALAERLRAEPAVAPLPSAPASRHAERVAATRLVGGESPGGIG